MISPERPAPFATGSAASIALTMGLAFAVMRLVFAASSRGWPVVMAATIAGSAVYFWLALRRCRAAERLELGLLPVSLTQPSRPAVRVIAPHQDR